MAPVCAVDRQGPTPTGNAVIVRGCVANAGGAPVAATVVVAHQAGVLESLATAFSLTATLGLCATGPHSCVDDGGRAVATHTDGRGQFELVLPPGSDAARPGTAVALLRLPGGVQAKTTFQVDGGRGGQVVVLQPLPAWNPSFRVAVSGDDLTASFGDQPGSWDDRTDLEVTDRYGQTNDLRVRPGVSRDAHMLPPGRDEVALSLEAGNVTYRTPAVPLVVDARSLALHARCLVMAPSGRTTAPTEEGGCGLTDGDWTQPGLDPEWLCGSAFGTDGCLRRGWSLLVDLGRIRQVTDVVVAGDAYPGEVSVSSNSRAWRDLGPLGEGTGRIASTGMRPPVSARYVRVTMADLSLAAEVAVF